MDSPFSSSEQKRLTAVSTKNIAMAVIASLLLCVCTAVLIPTTSGRILHAESEEVLAFMGPAMRDLSAPFEIKIIRDSRGSIFGHDLALALLPLSTKDSTATAKAVLIDLHDKAIVKAFSAGLMPSCTVVASAQSMDADNDSMRQFAKHLGSESTAWRMVLLHEGAHCLRNVASERVEALKRNKWVEKNPLHNELFALYMVEAYADAYAVLALSSMNNPATGARFDAKLIGEKSKAWRQGAASGPAYRTEHAIQSAVDMAERKQNNMATLSPADFDRMAMRCALLGSDLWFRFMKAGPEVIAPEFMTHLSQIAMATTTHPQGLFHG